MYGSSKRVLIVDDDPAVLRLLRRLLFEDYSLAEAASGEEALAILPDFKPDLVMLDVVMPGMDGYETCRRIRAHPAGHSVQIIVVSGKSSRDEQMLAYAAGADDYVVKPFDPHELRSRVRLHFRLRGALASIASAGRNGHGGPDSTDSEEFHRLQAMAHDVTVAALTKVAEFRDTETGEHLVRMRSYAQIVAEELSRNSPYAKWIDESFLEDLYRASPLHDIGKVGISDAILLKPAKLTFEEFETMKQHTVIGANILDHVAFGAPGVSFLRMAATVARFHHERFDGKGYPAGLSGAMIPLPARIVALADAYDAITSIRPYKTAQPPAAAREIIRKDSGTHFDPVIVDAFLRRFDAIVSVQRQTEDRFPVVIGAAALRREHLEPIAPSREYATV